ncbi:hypothetical protein [Methylophaga sp.]|uniref:hypothetical protein n=1 Tax=Methylophaga sp. TaxID=2024840 RepID=UPI003F6A4B54
MARSINTLTPFKCKPQSNLAIGLNGHVGCEAHKDIAFEEARAGLGPGEVDLYSSSYTPNAISGKGQSRITEAGNFDKCSVQLAQIQQGHYQQNGSGEAKQDPSWISPTQVKPVPTFKPDRLQAAEKDSTLRLQLKAIPQQ